jgi:hypothetical protein
MPWSTIIVFFCAILLLSSCASTKQARSVETFGFLGDLYPLMHKGLDGEALLV